MVTGIGVVSAQSSDNGNLAEEYAFKTHDDLLLEVHNLAPGFGGMFLSDDNTILYMPGCWTRLQSKTAKEALEQVFGEWMTEGLEFQAIQGQYDIGQLHEWYSRKRDAVWAIPGVHMTDLDEGDNQLEIRVDNPVAIEEVEEALSSLDIPLEAVNIQTERRPILARPSPQEAHTLEERAAGNTMVGGYMTTGVGGGCTLGFNATRAGKAGFVTVGHCTQSGKWDGGVQGTNFYQPSSAINPTAIGQEKTDPSASSTTTGCPSGHVCRYTDSAFIEYKSGVSYQLGKIAKPTSKDSIAVNSTDRFRIVKRETLPRSNETVHKVGRKSGWTSGRVISTCIDAGYAIRNPVTGDVKEVKLLCQGQVRAKAQGGDSGSAVFKVSNSPQQDDVELLGLLWSQQEDPDGDGATSDRYYLFSKIGNIYRELSLTTLDVWKSCDPSLNC